MTGSSSVVISNLAYLIGAIVLAIIGGFAVWLYHRQPKSIDANVDAFQRGLQAIAPDSSRQGPVRATPAAPEAFRVRPRSAVTLQTGQPKNREETAEVDMTQEETHRSAAGAGDGTSDRAGAETG